MGNNQLMTPTLQVNEDLTIFRSIYCRFPHTRNKASIMPRVQVIKQCVDYIVMIKSEVFAEVTATHTFKNTSQAQCYAFLPMHFIAQQKLLLLEIRVLRNEKLIEEGTFQRITHFLSEEPPINKFLDILSPDCQLKFSLQACESLQVQMKYLQTFQIHQNELLLMRIHFSSNYSVLINTPQDVTIMSLTHKLVSVQPGKLRVVEQPSTQLVLLMEVNHAPQVYLSKIPFGHSQYEESEKYCLLVSMIPRVMQGNALRDFLYFNNCCEDKDLKSGGGKLPTPPSNRTTLQSSEVGGGTQQPPINQLHSTHEYASKPRCVVFFVDCSNSMNSARMEIAKLALMLFVKSLPQDATYQIYCFGSRFERFYKEPVMVSEDNIRHSIDRIRDMQGDMGSTFLLGALEDSLLREEECELIWFILTDGYVAEQQHILGLLARHPQIRVYAFGIGPEFDKYMVESMARCGNGAFQFCESLSTLPQCIIEMLQVALATRFVNLQLREFNTQHISQMYLTQRELCVDRPLLIAAYFHPQQLDTTQTLSMSYQEDGSPLILNLNVEADFKEAHNHGHIHLYAWSLILEEVLFHVVHSDQHDLSGLQRSEANLQFWGLQRSSDRYPYLNPLCTLRLQDQYLCMNVALDRLVSSHKQHLSRSSPLTQLLQLVVQPTLREQLMSMQDSSPPLYEEDVFGQVVFSSSINQQYMLSLLLTQQTDGSFPYNSTLAMMKPHLTNNVVGIPQLEQQNIKLPQFLVEKVWSTALAVAYLRKNHATEKGQWLLMFVKARSFLNQYLSDSFDVLNLASRALNQDRPPQTSLHTINMSQ